MPPAVSPAMPWIPSVCILPQSVFNISFSKMTRSWQTWVLDSPRDTWTREFVEKLPGLSLAAIYLSTLFSYALAKTLLSDPLKESALTTPVAVIFIFHFGLQAVSFASAAFLM